MVNASFQLDSW